MTMSFRSLPVLASLRRASLWRYLLSAVAVVAAVGGAPDAADARRAVRARAAGGYDGYWNVLIITYAGACDRTYSFPVQIVGGRVLSTGGAAVSGGVGRGGAVVVRVSSGGSYATGSGRLGYGYGGGRWSGRGSAGFCSGAWRATRG